MKSQVPWKKEEIAILKKHGAHIPSTELVDLIPTHTAEGIVSKRRRLGIVLTDLCKTKIGIYCRSQVNENNLCKLDHSWTLDSLTNEEYQVLIGCQLGDGCVRKNGGQPKDRTINKRNYEFTTGHAQPCGDYTDWKSSILSRFLPKCYDKKYDSKENRNNMRELRTPSHPIFTLMREKFYSPKSKTGKDTIPMDLINRLDMFGLMIWYLDDGYLGVKQDGTSSRRRKKPSPGIVAKGYKYEDLVKVCEIFNKKYELSLKVTTHKHRGGMNKIIKIPAKDRTKILNCWRELAKKHNIPNSMYYKLNLHNSELLAFELRESRSVEPYIVNGKLYIPYSRTAQL